MITDDTTWIVYVNAAMGRWQMFQECVSNANEQRIISNLVLFYDDDDDYVRLLTYDNVNLLSVDQCFRCWNSISDVIVLR